ncbi:MAG TPA: hypothetical protein VFT29_10565 [Gemmatimonadaceae bacterium]|nr:hypothetical protein [Gemmatimonadaceae bacterium]
MSPVRRLSALVLVASGFTVLGFRAVPQIASSPQVDAPGESGASTGCQVRGVWELAASIVDGKDRPLAGYKQRKLVTERYWMWLGMQARRDTLPLKTQADSLRLYLLGGGGGTYTTSGSTYVEHIDIENDPSWVGTSFTATCRVEGDRWYHSFTIPNDTSKTKEQIHRLTEVWRRVE